MLGSPDKESETEQTILIFLNNHDQVVTFSSQVAAAPCSAHGNCIPSTYHGIHQDDWVLLSTFNTATACLPGFGGRKSLDHELGSLFLDDWQVFVLKSTAPEMLLSISGAAHDHSSTSHFLLSYGLRRLV